MEVNTNDQELNEVEHIKLASAGLRGGIASTLGDPEADGFSDDDKQLLKFHGMYQQKWRGNDAPEEMKKVYSFMIRGRIPGGRLTAQQYLVWDALAGEYGGATLRLTTRQSIQLHGLLKGNLRTILQEIERIRLSTMGACGDVVRNVTQAVNPWNDPDLNCLDNVAALLSDHFKFKSSGYAEIWLDQKPLNNPETDEIYGKSYLPRKFKIGVTRAGNNSIDIYTNDLAFAATGESGKVDGYFVFAGGGLGMTHKKPETFPRKADLLGWIPAEKLIPVAEAVVTAHRDFGDRTNRKHARLKYVLADKGVEWFRTEVENRAAVKFDGRALPDWKTPSYLGWQSAGEGMWALGLHILAGRIIDRPGSPLRTVLARLIREYSLSSQITPDQDLILLAIKEKDKTRIEEELVNAGIHFRSPSKLYDRALACPALPTCGLALTDSERNLPDLAGRINSLLEKYDLLPNAPVLRMTGCPNGCARPYTAEIGFVGQMNGGKYALFLGGDAEGTRIGTLVAEKFTFDQIDPVFDELFRKWKESGVSSFGDWIHIQGTDAIRSQISSVLSS